MKSSPISAFASSNKSLKSSDSVANDKYVNNLLISCKLLSSGFSSSFFSSFITFSSFFSPSCFFKSPDNILFLLSSFLSPTFLISPDIKRVSSVGRGDISWNLSSFNIPGTKSFLVYNPFNFFPFLS